MNQEMTIWGHLSELRKRLLYSILGLIICVIISALFGDFLLEFIAQPIGGLENLLSIQVTENIQVYFQVTMLSGFIMSFPFILIQIYFFISPGLERNERRWLYVAIPIATFLFISGAFFAFFVMLPTALPFLVQFPGPNVLPKWKDYVSFVTNLIFWIGLSFQTPLLMYLLAKLGVVDAKGLARQWRFAIIIIAAIAAIATPTPDPINMVIMMAPLIVLFLLGILMASLANKKR